MSPGPTVTVADILELRAGGLTEDETWALLCQAAQTLQDLFLSEGISAEDIAPVVTPHTLGISSKGRVVLEVVRRLRGHHEPYLAPEYAAAGRDFDSVDWEKMWVYSLGKTLLSALRESPPADSLWILSFMTAKDPNSRASLMSLLNILSEHWRTSLPPKPFSHLVVEMHREVFGTPPRERRGAGGCGSGGCVGGVAGGVVGRGEGRRRAVQRAPSRLYRGGRGGGGRCVGPEFVVRGREAERVVHVGEVKGSQRRSVTVVLLTGQRVRVTCDPQRLTCGRLLEVVVEVEELEENYMFGLACLMGGEMVFVPGEMKVGKVAPAGWREGAGEEGRGGFLVFVRVKFFLPSLRGLRSGKTRHWVYLQLRRSLLEQEIRCEAGELLVLGGLALQAEFGDFEEGEHGRGSYFLAEHYVPEEMLEGRGEVERGLEREHRSRAGLEAVLAEEIFVAQVQRLPEYGSHHYTAEWVRKSVSIPMWVTVNPHGVYLYEKKKSVLERKIHEAFVWKNIQGLTCNEQYFRLVPQDVLGQKGRMSYKLKMESKKSYFLFRLASFHHQFFLKLRIELSPLEALSQEFGVRLRGKEGGRGYRVEGGVEERQNKENEGPEEEEEGRREKRTGVRMGVRAFGCPREASGAYVIETSIRTSPGKFVYEVQESVSGGLARRLEEVSWAEERVLRRVRLSKDKYGSFGLEVVEGGNGGVFVENVLKGGGEGGVVRGDQLVSVNGVCLLSLRYSEALGVLRGAGSEMEVVVGRRWGGGRGEKPVEEEYLRQIRYETANETESLESEGLSG